MTASPASSPRLSAADRRLNLIHAASDTFLEYGYTGTTTRMLADAAGITEPILYRHFSNKADLFLGVLEYAAIALEEPETPQHHERLLRFAGLCITACAGPDSPEFRSQTREILHRVESSSTEDDAAAMLELIVGRLVLEHLRHQTT